MNRNKNAEGSGNARFSVLSSTGVPDRISGSDYADWGWGANGIAEFCRRDDIKEREVGSFPRCEHASVSQTQGPGSVDGDTRDRFTGRQPEQHAGHVKDKQQ